MQGQKSKFILAGLFAALSVPAVAQFAVIDVSSIAKEVEEISWLSQQYTQMVSEYNQLVQTYTMITNQFNQLVANARGLGNLPRQFIAPFTRWKFPSAFNHYGTSNAWVNTLLTGNNASAGYTAATLPLSLYNWAYISGDAQAADELKYSTLELTDGLAENSMTTVGSLRANASAAADAIAQLEANTDEAAADPSEVQALQNIGSADVIGLRNQQDTNQVLASLLETQTLGQKAQRDAMASSISSEIAFSNNIAAHFDAMFGPEMQQGVDDIGLIP